MVYASSVCHVALDRVHKSVFVTEMVLGTRKINDNAI